MLVASAAAAENGASEDERSDGGSAMVTAGTSADGFCASDVFISTTPCESLALKGACRRGVISAPVATDGGTYCTTNAVTSLPQHTSTTRKTGDGKCELAGNAATGCNNLAADADND